MGFSNAETGIQTRSSARTVRLLLADLVESADNAQQLYSNFNAIACLRRDMRTVRGRMLEELE
jgi:hypothetical protein